jgi:hypothetical protein
MLVTGSERRQQSKEAEKTNRIRWIVNGGGGNSKRRRRRRGRGRRGSEKKLIAVDLWRANVIEFQNIPLLKRG